jgi:amino acid permease
MINYLFYRFSQIKIYRPTYWARIFVPVLVILAFMPVILTLSKYYFGCYDIQANDSTIKIVLSSIVILVWIAISFYYSPQKIKRITDKYSGESKLWGNMKLLFISLLLVSIFWFGSALIRHLIEIPDC